MNGYEKVKSCCWVTGTAGALYVCYELCGAITSAKNLMNKDLKETMGTAREAMNATMNATMETMGTAREAMNDARKTMDKVNGTLDATQSAIHEMSYTASEVPRQGVLRTLFGWGY